MPTVRSASLHGFAALVAELGGDASDIARRVGMPTTALCSYEVPVEVEVSARALELAARDLSCPDLGLRLGDLQQLAGLGPLALGIRHSPDLGGALECARRFLTLHNQGSTLVLTEDPYDVVGIAGLCFTWLYDGSTFPQAMDKALLNVHRVVQALAGGDYDLRTVELSYRSAAPVHQFSKFFGGARINLEQPQTMLRMPQALLRQEIAGAQSAIRDMAMLHLRAQALPDELCITRRVRTVMLALLGGGRLSTRLVAAHLEISPRTLQRRLAVEQTTYAAVLDGVRCERAFALLAETALPIAHISAMIDFADPATFSRAARRWWKVPPREKRRQLRGEQGPHPAAGAVPRIFRREARSL